MKLISHPLHHNRILNSNFNLKCRGGQSFPIARSKLSSKIIWVTKLLHQSAR